MLDGARELDLRVLPVDSKPLCSHYYTVFFSIGPHINSTETTVQSEKK